MQEKLEVGSYVLIIESNRITTEVVMAAGPFMFAMINAKITKKKGAFKTEEGCLSLDGVRPCTRYKEIEVDYLDQSFKPQHEKYSVWTAQIIQHELDYVAGIVI